MASFQTSFLGGLLMAAAVLSLPGCGGGGAAGGDSAVAGTSGVSTASPGAAAAGPADTGAEFAANAGDAPAPVPGSPGFAAAGTNGLAKIAALSGTGAASPSLTIHARGDLANGVGPILQLRIDGAVVGSFEVRSTQLADYTLSTPTLKAGSKVDVVFTNDAVVNGQDRNVYIDHLSSAGALLLPSGGDSLLDLGYGDDAFDGKQTMPGRGDIYWSAALRLTWPATTSVDDARTLVLRARADLAAGVGPIVQLRIDGATVGSVEVRSTELADYTFSTPGLKAGSKVDLVFTNDAVIAGQDRNLYIGYVSSGDTQLLPSAPGNVLDIGSGADALDGRDTVAGQGDLYGAAALRMSWPAAAPASAVADGTPAARNAAAFFLTQASFGATTADITRLSGLSPAAWIDEQMALPAAPYYVNYVQSKYALGDAYRPGGPRFDAGWVGQQFWASAAKAPDQLRQRVGWALHQIFMASQTDANLWGNARAYANYVDTLNKHAFGNYRTLLEEVALSPAMGIYLSHMRNRKEDPITGRVPDENFAREVMQLFSIGLHELNVDGTPKLDAAGKPIETYSNADVMEMAKVFTGWGWAFPDAQLTEHNFRWGIPDISTANDSRIDLQRMKAYPGQHSTAAKRLFSGKANAVVIPAGSSAADSLRIALDALYRHPNVGPFIGRQLIQRLVTGSPSPAYVARVAATFNNNGQGVRGDLGAVVRAVLLDTEARSRAAGKLREPVLRVTAWLRAFDAKSSTGDYMMAWELESQGQRALYAPSVFGYYRPGYVPPAASFASGGVTAPEFQIVDESSTAAWVNLAQAMSGEGLGWTGAVHDVSVGLAAQAALSASGNLGGLADNLNLLLFAGSMSSELRQALMDAAAGVGGGDAGSHLNRARVALFLALASNEYLVQR